MLDLFRTPKLRKYSISLCFIFPAIALVYYGISYNIGNFGGNFLVSFTLGGLIELPSILIIIFLMRHFGRKTLAIASFSLNAIASLVMIIDVPILRVVFALIAKFANQGERTFMSYIFMETFPTEMRNTVVGLTKMVARIGAIIAPFIKDIVRKEKKNQNDFN